MKNTILVTGLHGFIGSHFAKRATNKFDLIDYSRQAGHKTVPNVMIAITGDIRNKHAVYSAIKHPGISAVLHLAAKAHIDNCEADKPFKKHGETWQVNVEGTRNIARGCAAFGKYLFYLSTECVFDGKKGWFTENDHPSPINWYGTTKLEAEKEIVRSGAKYCILRSVLALGGSQFFSSDLYQVFGKKLKENKKLRVVDDQEINFTYINDLVDVISLLIRKKTSGLYHFAGLKAYTPYTLALKIAEAKDLKTENIVPVPLKEYFGPSAKLRLRKATLSSQKLIKSVRLTQIGLDQFLSKMKS